MPIFLPNLTPQKAPLYQQGLESRRDGNRILDKKRVLDNYFTSISGFSSVKFTPADSTPLLPTNKQAIIFVDASTGTENKVLILPPATECPIQPVSIARTDGSNNQLKIRTTSPDLIINTGFDQATAEITLLKNSSVNLQAVNGVWYLLGGHNFGSQSNVDIKVASAKVGTSYSQTPSGRAYLKVLFNTAVINPNNLFSTTNNNYVVNSNGYITISGFFGLSASNYDTTEIAIFANNRLKRVVGNMGRMGVNGVPNGESFILTDFFVAGDVIDLRVAFAGSGLSVLDTSTISFLAFEL